MITNVLHFKKFQTVDKILYCQKFWLLATKSNLVKTSPTNVPSLSYSILSLNVIPIHTLKKNKKLVNRVNKVITILTKDGDGHRVLLLLSTSCKLSYKDILQRFSPLIIVSAASLRSMTNFHSARLTWGNWSSPRTAQSDCLHGIISSTWDLNILGSGQFY